VALAGPEGDLPPIGSPNGGHIQVARRGYPQACAAREIFQPDIGIPPRINDRPHQARSIGREAQPSCHLGIRPEPKVSSVTRNRCWVHPRWHGHARERQHVRRRAQQGLVAKRRTRRRKRDGSRLARECERRRIERPRLDPVVDRREQEPGGVIRTCDICRRHVGAKEPRRRTRRRGIDTRQIHAAAFVDQRDPLIEEVDAVREKHGIAVRDFVCSRVELRHRFGRTAAGTDTEQRRVPKVGLEHDDVFAAPGPTTRVVRISEHNRRAALHRHFHQLAPGKEADESAVGRPERLLRPFRARNGDNLQRCEVAHEQPCPGWLAADKRDALLVRRDHRSRIERHAVGKTPGKLP
jgi:hypothetical protein